MTLIEFLRARVEEEHAHWGRAVRLRVTSHDKSEAARALANVEAKRRIIAECDRTLDVEEHGWVLAGEVLAMLAQPYVDHEDFDPAWAPRMTGD